MMLIRARTSQVSLHLQDSRSLIVTFHRIMILNSEYNYVVLYSAKTYHFSGEHEHRDYELNES